jgi:uncharacterized protein YndB with AHSA1/START domain
MTKRSSQHATFVLERTYEAPPARVFAQWASREAKARWFGVPDEDAYALDFKVGGRERNQGGPPDGPLFTYDAEYQEIVPDARIVYSYTMDAGATRISVSVTTVEFKHAGNGTQLIFTEQGVFLDGGDTPGMRQSGTSELLDKLDQQLGSTGRAGPGGG